MVYTHLNTSSASLPEPPPPSQEILFPAQDEWADSAQFPPIAGILKAKKDTLPCPLKEFGVAVSNSTRRILIIDKYLFNPDQDSGPLDGRISSFCDWLLECTAFDIRILTQSQSPENEKDVKNKFESMVDVLNDIRQSTANTLNKLVFQICFKPHLFCNIHDRFAVIDNDLWHFGATVGGFHKGLNAASHGWNASEIGAIEVFNHMWNS
jgi:hypothetical protein